MRADTELLIQAKELMDKFTKLKTVLIFKIIRKVWDKLSVSVSEMKTCLIQLRTMWLQESRKLDKHLVSPMVRHCREE